MATVGVVSNEGALTRREAPLILAGRFDPQESWAQP